MKNDTNPSIRSLPLPNDILEILERADINTINELLSINVYEFRKAPGIGEVRINKVNDALKNIGLNPIASSAHSYETLVDCVIARRSLNEVILTWKNLRPYARGPRAYQQ